MLRTPTDRASCLLIATPVTSKLSRHYISFASAINRGIRRTNDNSDRLGARSPKSGSRIAPASPVLHSSRSKLEQQRLREDGQSLFRRRRSRRLIREDVSEEAPLATPYTTAGSEFLYGTFAIKAALEANRRTFYKLYIWRGQNDKEDEYDRSLSKLAKTKKIPVRFVAGTWDKMLAKMSGQRPHNGYVLEVSVIPKISITTLQALDHPGAELRATITSQSAEDQTINSIFTESALGRIIPRTGIQSRYPLLLWLDRITDTGNLGAIIRTAHFMGVDAVIVTEHGTAPFSPVTIKASAGAAEILPILTIKRELDFILKSQRNGWKFIAAVAPDSASTWKQLSHQRSFVAENALDNSPCVLMLGNEGEGLRAMVQKAADNFVSIRGVRGHADGVESLNVSVAAALLIARMLARVPSPTGKPSTDSSRLASETSADASHIF